MSLPWHVLPNELKTKVMQQLVPFSVSITDYDSRPGQAVRRPDNEPWASREALAMACLASRQLETICKPLLYETIAVKDCRELLCLLRTLSRDPRLRNQVRRFAWVHLIRGIDVNQPMVNMGPRLEELLAECCHVWPKTRRDRTLAELFQLRTTDPTAFSLWKVLGVVVATLPRVRTLFLTHGGPQLDHRGFNNHAELDAMALLLTPALLPPSALWWSVTRRDIDREDPSGSAARIHQQNPRALRLIEEIILDTCDGAGDQVTAGINTPWTLWFFILNCPRLRRVEIKGAIIFHRILNPRVWAVNNPDPGAEQFYAPPNLLLLPQPVAPKVREIVMHRLQAAQWGVLQRLFPNVERLVAVFQDGEWRYRYRHWNSSPLPETPILLLIPDLGRAIHLFQGTLRSLTVTGFLSNNGETTREGYESNARKGQEWAVADISPLLSPGLPHVPLTELTTDCVWLFGREDPSVAYQVPSLLPSSLASLHLIDYWAVPVDEEVVEGGERLSYYPVFPSGLAPLAFLDEVFAILRNSCAAEHARLESITLSSPLFDEGGRWSTPDTQPIDRSDVQTWSENVRIAFSKIGVRFSFTTMKHLETNMRSSWARI